jgi:hypothetical protein
MAARLETLKQLGRTVLLSRAFADFVEREFDLERIGEFPVRSFNDPIACSRITAECQPSRCVFISGDFKPAESAASVG